MSSVTRYSRLYVLAAWLVAGIFFVVMLQRARNAQRELVCRGIEVVIDYSKGARFVDENGIKKLIIGKLPNNSVSVPINLVNLQSIEDYLETNPHIATAELYFDYNGKLWAEISQQTPLLRVVNNQNTSYYIGLEGKKMPVSTHFTARVPIATGNITDNNQTYGELDAPTVKQLYDLCVYMKDNPFLNSLVEQIYVNADHDMVLIPKIGKHRIVIGNTDQLDEKFHKLRVFYAQAMPQVGWNTYEVINLKFANQIVCSR